MDNTNYFININVQNILSIVNECISQVDTASKIDVQSVLSDSVWMSNSKLVFKSYLEKNEEDINELKKSLDTMVEILNKAQKVKNLEQEMDSISDSEKLIEYIKEIKKIMSEILQEATSIKELVKNTNNENIYKDQNEIRIDYNGINAFVNGISGSNSLSSYSTNLNGAYLKLDALQTDVSYDEYIYYVWSKVIVQFDTIIKRCDTLVNWITNYLNEVRTYEDSMPESIPLVVNTIEKVSNYKDHSTINVNLPSEFVSLIDEENNE